LDCAVADSSVETPIQKYLRVISEYNNAFKKWDARVNKIIKRYRDDTRSNAGNQTAKFNILWSNVQTLIPAVYAKLPKADVSRRFGDNDQIGRVAALLIERAIDFEIEHYPDFRATMKHAVEDRFLGGRGVAWVRYEPHIKAQEIDTPPDGLQVTEDAEPYEEGSEVAEEIEYECAPVDYVHWRDFGHNAARTWEEVTQVWRIVYMTKQMCEDRFGPEKCKKIPMNEGPEPLTGTYPKKDNNQAKIFELWDKETKKAYWFTEEGGEFLDERDDPLELEGFFPCDKPLYATTTSDSLVPVPDFILYQDQAQELDILSDRIDGLVKALRVRGVYDASVPALQRLLTEGDNNTLIPVETWNAFSEKNGLKGTIDLLPLDTIAQALMQCYQARQDIKGQIYEITGIADIIRGQTEASETATAQQIKGQYAGLRLRSMQEDVALFATGLIRLKAQVICQHFQPETILQYAAVQQLTDVDQQMVPQALELIKSQPLRNFRIEIAADSLVQIDEQAEKQSRLEFIQAYATFLGQSVEALQTAPQLMPLAIELLRYGTGAFKQARQIEGTLDAILEKVKQQQQQAEANPQPPKPDPEMLKMQAEQQNAQADRQMQAQKDQQEMQLEQMRIQAEQANKRAEMQMEEMRAANENMLEIRKMLMQFQHDKEMQREAKAMDRETAIEVAKNTPEPAGAAA
jgi:hypothetical protein